MERVYTVKEIAHSLRVSENTVLRLIRKVELAAFRIGKSLRIKASDVPGYHTVPTNEVAK